MKKSAYIALAARDAASVAQRRAQRWAAIGLCVVGLSGLTSCQSDVPPSTTGDGIIALFNPAVTPPIVPAPTDLVRDPVSGMLAIPVDPNEATYPALAAFNGFLRGLDGFPPDTTASTTFSDALDTASLAEALVVYDATAGQFLAATDAVASLDATAGNKRMVVTTKNRWSNGHTYLIGLFSWQDSGTQHGLRGENGKAVIADTAFVYLRSQTPIYAKCQDATNAACACPDLSSKSCHSVVDGLNDTQALQLEVARLGMQPLIDAAVAQKGRTRPDLVMGWSFTISTRSFAAFDPDRSQAPFPSNLLLANKGLGDPKADVLVNIPILPTDDAKTQGLKTGLNTLDGFTTTGSVTFPIDSATVNNLPLDINSATVLPGRTAFLINLDVPTQQPNYSAKPLHALLDPVGNVSGFAKQIWVTPLHPLLGDRTSYVSVLTQNIKDMNGNALLPATATVLLTQGYPLVDNTGKSVISTIPDAQAAQIEILRQALTPLFTELGALGIAPTSLAAFTVYRTQSIVKPIQQLLGGVAQLAGAGLVPTGVTFLNTYTGPFPATLNNLSAIIHGTLTVRRVVDLRGPFNTSRLAATPAANDTIPFMMTLPTTALTPAGGAPVIIAQHGLTRWRGDTLALAQTMAGKGMAMIAIDVIYHGGRVICLADADCATGITCNQPAPVNGMAQPGKCNGAYLPSPTATPVPGTTDVAPDPSLPSRDFTNLVNPFAQRDNFRQHMLDLFQLVRVIKDTTANTSLNSQINLNGTLPTINQAKIGYIGQSLGAILGTTFLSLSPQVNLGVLNVGGGYLVDIFTDPNSSLSAGVATSLGVTPGTPDFYSLIENFRWIVDPADPINFARFVRAPDSVLTPGRSAAKVILQEAGMDMVISNQFTLALGKELGLPLDTNQHLEGLNQEGTLAVTPVSTFFSAADHGALLNFTNAALTLTIQNQAATYLFTGLNGVPTVQ